MLGCPIGLVLLNKQDKLEGVFKASLVYHSKKGIGAHHFMKRAKPVIVLQFNKVKIEKNTSG